MRAIPILTIVYLSSILFWNAATAQLPTVSMIVDGERLVLSDGARLQLLGVDAPEKHASARLTEEAARTGRSEEAVKRQGEISAAYLSALARGHSVEVEYLKPRAIRGLPGSPYTPALVYVVDEQGRVAYSLNERMLRDGYAFFSRIDDDALGSRLERLQSIAQEAHLGLWAEGETFAPSRPIDSRVSEGADLFSTCRTDPACVWLSQTGSVDGVGVWRSKPGKSCPCEGKP